MSGRGRQAAPINNRPRRNQANQVAQGGLNPAQPAIFEDELVNFRDPFAPGRQIPRGDEGLPVVVVGRLPDPPQEPRPNPLLIENQQEAPIPPPIERPVENPPKDPGL